MEEGRAERGASSSKWERLKGLLLFKSLACCGSPWADSARAIQMAPVDNDGYDYDYSNESRQRLIPVIGGGEETNLAAALAAERQLRAVGKVPLARLLEEGERARGRNRGEEEECGGGAVEVGPAGAGCCVCMGREKGAAFIPCGHTFCRVCARKLWIHRGACPLCNRTILEILDIF